jgi:hypothetical protein
VELGEACAALGLARLGGAHAQQRTLLRIELMLRAMTS